MSAHDISVAQTVWPLVKSTPASDLRSDPGRTIDRAAGRHLTPGEMAALYGIASRAQHDDQKGSIWDGVGGWVNGETGGLVTFGNPDTARYRGGEDASWIPLSPESVEEDGERGLAKFGGEEAARSSERAASDLGGGDGDRRTFVTTPRGTTFDIPPGYEPREAANEKGIVYQRPGALRNAGSIRIMEPTPRYPDGYYRFYNNVGAGQPLDVNGRPGGQQATHIHETYAGPVREWPR